MCDGHRTVLTKDQAIDAVRKTLPSDFSVIEENTVEKEYGWVIFSQTKRYIETNDCSFMAIGLGGILVEKDTGRLIQFGSAYSLEHNLEIYEAGYLAYDNFDLIVTAVLDREEVLKLLGKLGITYVKPEVSFGTTWTIPKTYSHRQLLGRLGHLPCRFNLGQVYFKFKELESMRASTSLQFELVENTGFCNEA
jgi:hypothetical protein